MPRYRFTNGTVWVDTSAFSPSQASRRQPLRGGVLIAVHWKEPAGLPNVSALATKESSPMQFVERVETQAGHRQP